MAGELASAIALQGQPRNRPQSVGPSEVMIENAFNGRKRAEDEKKAKEDAEAQKRMDQIMKNTAFSQQFENPYYNRQYQKDAVKAMDEIVQANATGDKNAVVVGYNKVRELESIMNTYLLADKNMSAARKAASEKPDEYAGLFNPQRIGSETYNTMFDALNDPKLAGMEDFIAEQFGSPSSSFVKENVNGNDIGVAMFNLQNARTADPTKKAGAALTDNSRFTRPGKEIVINNRDTQLKVIPTHLDDTYLEQIALEVYSDPAVVNNAVMKDFNKAKAVALEIDPSKNFTWKDYEQLRGNLGAVATKDADEFIANARKMTGTPYQVSNTLKAEKEATPSDFEKVFTVATTPAYISAEDEKGLKTGYNVIPYSSRPGKNLAKVNVDLPAGHYEIMSGKIKKVDSPNSLPAIPKGPAWLDGKLGFMYTNDSETYFNPLDQGSYQMWIQHTGVPEEDVIKQITLVGGGSKQAESQAKAWMEKMGLQGTTPSGQQKSPSAAPASGTINLQDLPVGAKIEVKNGKNYYNGKEIKM